MGFFSELKNSFKEGVEEGRAELAAEKSTDQIALESLLQRTSYEEQFGMSLAAPFRVEAFQDWFTIFDDEETDDELPIHLYAISEPGLVDKGKLKTLKKLMARDFEVTDEQSALWMVGQLFAAAAVPSQTEFPYIEDKDDTWARWASIIYNHRLLNEDFRKDALTFVVNMAAHGIAASCNLGYLQTDVALALLGDLRVFIKSLYRTGGSWEEYGARFLAANDIFEFNDKKGMDRLRLHFRHLVMKPGSPWNAVPFYLDGEEIIAFDELVKPPLIIDLYEEDEIEAVEAHIQEHFGKFDNVMHELVSPDIHLDVAVIEPSDNLDRYVLVTIGAGAYIMNVPEELGDQNLYRMELLTVLPADWNINSDEGKDYWPIGSLKAMGRYPLEEETWLGNGHTVQFDEGDFPETGFMGYLLCNPQIGSKDAGCCTLSDGSDVNFYQLIPLYADEVEFKIEYGSDALLDKFTAKYGSDYDFAIDPTRQSVLIK